MDIRNILNESYLSHRFGGVEAYRNLDPMSVAVLKKLAMGGLDVETASEKVQTAVEHLIALGLINDFDYSINDNGLAALRYVERLGGTKDRREAQLRSQAHIAAEPEMEMDNEEEFA
jgi:hypothetical protein